MSVDMKNMINLVRMGGATLSGVTPANTSLVDMQGYEGLTVVLQNGTVTTSGSTGFTLKLQHSDTTVAANFVDVPAAQIIPTAAGATTITSSLDADDDILINSIGYRGPRRYVRAVVTGSTGTAAVVVVLGIRAPNSSASAPVAAVTLPTAAT